MSSPGEVNIYGTFTACDYDYSVTVSALPLEGGTVTGGGTSTCGDSLTLSAVPNEGYVFNGWYRIIGGDYHFISSEATIEYCAVEAGTTELTAFFEELCLYTVSVSSSPLEGGTATGSGTYECGEYAFLSATANEGYIFSGWYYLYDGEYVYFSSSPEEYIYISEASDLDFIAMFVTCDFDFNVIATPNPIEGGTVTGGGTGSCGESVLLTATPNEDYVFDAWYLVEEDGSYLYLSSASTYYYLPTSAGEHNLIAGFYFVGPCEYTLAVSASPAIGGTVTGAGTYDCEYYAYITATPSEGYIFNGWYYLWEGVYEYYSSMPEEYIYVGETIDLEFVAMFTLCDFDYSVSVSAEPSEGGTVSGGGAGTCGESVTVTAIASDGYIFDSWYRVDGEDYMYVSSDATYSYSPTSEGETNLVAYFYYIGDCEYSIEALSSPVEGGVVTGTGTYNCYEAFTAVATANEGYTFTGWYEYYMGEYYILTESTVFTASLEFPAEAVIVAMFEPGDFTITTSSLPIEGGTTTGGGTYEYGDAVTVVATPNTGYTFSNWTEGGTIVAETPSYNFTVSSNRNLVANFDTIPSNIGKIDLTQYLDIYPIPFDNIVNIQSKDLKIESIQLIDNLGRQILNEVYDNRSYVIVNTEGISAGYYYLRVNTDKGEQSFKIVKK